MQKKMLFKLIILGIISLIMTAVLSSISGLSHERKYRQMEVERGIAGSYAGEQQLIGPVFSVTFREYWMERLYNKEKDTWYDKEMCSLRTELVFPEQFSFDGSLRVQERYRGIFKANVFQSSGTVQGNVKFPEFKSLSAREGSRTELVSVNANLLISDKRGLSKVPKLKWNGAELDIKPGNDLEQLYPGVHAEIPDMKELFGKQFDFGLNLDVYGMGQLAFVPIGAENRIQLKSDWPHPSFIGDFLATDRTITGEGFEAEWNVNGLACSARQQLKGQKKGAIQQLGVSFVDPVNPYALTDRALKYGFLFIFITFSAFFLFEMLAELKIHPVQYGLVGLAQAVFFLLLLSLSEHLGFGISYTAASTATIGLIVFYVCHVLKGIRRGFAFGGLLALLYGVLFALLQSEDHALVAGSALVFGLLTLVMLVTRKVDWYSPGAARAAG